MATNLDFQIKNYQKLLNRSNTAGTNPTSADIYNQSSLVNLQNKKKAEETANLKEQWYGTDTQTENAGDTSSAPQGYIKSVLHGLAVPLYTVVGALEHVLGKGTEPGLIENIESNIKEEGTSGDLLRKYGVSNFWAMPLGFGLDLTFDPFTIATMGTQSIIPRITKGLLKGGVKGATTAVTSSALTKAESLGKFIPGLKKAANVAFDAEKGIAPIARTVEGVTSVAKPVTKAGTFYNNLMKSAYESRTAYNKITTGTGLPAQLIRSGEKVRVGPRVSQWLDNYAFGRTAKKLFGYDATGTNNIMRVANEKTAEQMKKTQKLFFNDAIETLENYKNPEYLDKAKKLTAYKRGIVESENIAPALSNSLEETSYLQTEMQKTINDLAEIVKNPKDLAKLKKLDDAPEELKKFLIDFDYYRSNVLKGYNKVVAKALLSKTGRTILHANAILLGNFKNMKIGWNPAIWPYSVAGNLSMNAMVSGGVSPQFISRVKNVAEALLVDKSKTKILKLLTQNDDLMRSILRNPEVFRSVTGVDADAILRGKSLIDIKAKELFPKGIDPKEIDKIKDIWDGVFKNVQLPGGFTTTLGATNLGINLGANIRTAGVPSNIFLVGEIIKGPYGIFLDRLSKSGNKYLEFYAKAMTKPLDAYGKIDQTFRLAKILNLVEDGVTEKELSLLAKRFALTESDYVSVPGRNIWKIKPDKAIDIATETYMNYSALPDFVKVMRVLPIIGAPFGSFTYAMGANIGKTALYNPAFFNKVQFLLKEISGGRTPAEVQALESKYYSYLNKPGMVKLPFLKDNPLFLNTANYFPHYTFNLLQTPNRTYEEKFGGAVASLVDKSPFFKEPGGQIFFDYVIQPLVLGIERPQGMFGQPLWTKDAGLGEKIGRAALSAVETQMPPAAAFAGLVTPEWAIPYAPTYGWRQLANAVRAKTALGIPTNEEAGIKTLRTIGSKLGFPTYQMQLKYNKK